VRALRAVTRTVFPTSGVQTSQRLATVLWHMGDLGVPGGKYREGPGS
jgi:hypothetical protein